MALVPVQEVEGASIDATVADVEAVLDRGGAGLPEGWAIIAATTAQLAVGFAEESLVPTPYGGHSLGAEALAQTPIATYERMPVTHVMLQRGVETAWIQIVEVETALSQRFADVNMALGRTTGVQGGAAHFEKIGGRLRLGALFMRITVMAGSTPEARFAAAERGPGNARAFILALAQG